MRDKSPGMPAVDSPGSLRTLRVWHCSYYTLSAIAGFGALEGLEIATFPDESFDVLADLKDLRYLHVVHLPHVTDLGPLSRLSSLKTLRLATLPSWDSAGRTTIVESLDPLTELPSLQHVELFGVVPKDGSLAALERCQALRTARFSKYRESEVQRFYEATSLAASPAPAPDF